jgi:hypothetical protein
MANFRLDPHLDDLTGCRDIEKVTADDLLCKQQ